MCLCKAVKIFENGWLVLFGKFLYPVSFPKYVKVERLEEHLFGKEDVLSCYSWPQWDVNGNFFEEVWNIVFIGHNQQSLNVF
jgi:hypothetical protein